ncbi:MAG: GIY-YIG nuclease family protein [Thalassobaculum sp.]|uniref:GIY-YIG nuclease family protein n=1 Tax=Thalassobaculum sp. TaxID=2022740 RepID=UPI0032EC03E4
MARTLRPCVYILASKRNGTLYVGVTADLIRRVWAHREQPPGFSARYRVNRPVWFEPHPDMLAAIQRETRLKGWRRAWKTALIEQTNPEWNDLYPALAGVG